MHLNFKVGRGGSHTQICFILFSHITQVGFKLVMYVLEAGLRLLLLLPLPPLCAIMPVTHHIYKPQESCLQIEAGISSLV